MNSTVIYDILNEDFIFWTLSKEYIIVPLLLLVIVFYFSIKKNEYRKIFVFSGIFLLWVVVLSVGILFRYSTYTKVKKARLNNEFEIVNGTINNLKIETGRINFQNFTVNGVLFEISDNVTNGGYNKTVLNGSPIREGACVKIYYINKINDNIIVRLELMKKTECK